jgi:hypothetical protein
MLASTTSPAADHASATAVTKRPPGPGRTARDRAYAVGRRAPLAPRGPGVRRAGRAQCRQHPPRRPRSGPSRPASRPQRLGPLREGGVRRRRRFAGPVAAAAGGSRRVSPTRPESPFRAPARTPPARRIRRPPEPSAYHAAFTDSATPVTSFGARPGRQPLARPPPCTMTSPVRSVGSSLQQVQHARAPRRCTAGSRPARSAGGRAPPAPGARSAATPSARRPGPGRRLARPSPRSAAASHRVDLDRGDVAGRAEQARGSASRAPARTSSTTSPARGSPARTIRRIVLGSCRKFLPQRLASEAMPSRAASPRGSPAAPCSPSPLTQ